MTSKFSPLQPGVLKFTMAALAERWPEWDDEAERFGPGESTACWPEREVVAAEVLRALSDAGFAKGVLRSDYADLLDPERLAAVTADRMHAVVDSNGDYVRSRKGDSVMDSDGQQRDWGPLESISQELLDTVNLDAVNALNAAVLPLIEAAAKARQLVIDRLCEEALQGGVCGVSVYGLVAMVDPEVPYGYIHHHQRARPEGELDS